VADALVRYRSPDEDSGRWVGFPFRDGDIVISTRSKSGTTWMQMICALLVFRTEDLPAPLSELSPWLDWLVTPREVVYDQLAAQRHRRFIKTHTPLDGVPVHPGATYIVVGRNPLDVAVSLYHHGDNIDRVLWRQLTGQPEAPPVAPPRPELHDWLVGWIHEEADPGLLRHLSDAWARRDDGNVVLVHYDDLTRDLAGQMRALAARLDIALPARLWPELVQAATFEQMRGRAALVSPAPAGILKDPSAFFRQGRSGSGAQVLTSAEVADYRRRAADLAEPDLLAWLHGPGS
jgi:aryl sulfotransferase